MVITGYAYKLGDNINTDVIISGRYKFQITDMKELSRHIFEDIDPDFAKNIKPGESIIVAGENFGLGSSREQAPLAIKAAGIVAVVAKSFARIFFRNSFNVGLPLIELDTNPISQSDKLEIDLDNGRLTDLTKNKELKSKPIPPFMQDLLKEDGVINYFKKHGDLKFDI
ncbi:MAG: 3-isopropylmalate dehydratase small subunit [Candidatus Omnitrophota bacterium]